MTPARAESGAVAVVAALLGGAAAATARRAPEFAVAGDSIARLALGVTAGWAVVAAGIVLRAGGSRLAGRLLAAAGCAWLAAGLASPGARLAPLFTLGLVTVAAAPALLGHALVAEAPGSRAVAGALYATLVGIVGLVPALLYDPAAEGCAACPPNLLGLADAPAAAAAIVRWGLRLGLFAIAACIVLALWRLSRAPGARRRRTWPLIAPGCAYLALAAADLAHALRRGVVGGYSADQTLWSAQAAALLGVAAGVALLRVAAQRRRARLARLVVELAETPRPGALSEALAALLGDPQLELLHAASDGWIDADGNTRTPPADATATPLVRDGEPVALLCHRHGLLDDSRTVAEIERSVRLGLDHERLQAQLRLELAHVRRSRADVSAASEAERRLLERDLHDGAQARIAAFTFAAAVAAHRVAPPLATRLERARQEVQHALDELREIAQGLYPVALAEAGLAAAIESLSDRRSALTAAGLPSGRLAPALEETAYFAIATLAEQWSPHPVKVVAARDHRCLTLDVSAPTRPPEDLIAIDDRLAAVDGTLTINALAPELTRVRIELPCA